MDAPPDTTPRHEPLAWISLASSAIGLVLCILIFPSIIAVVCGHLARRRIRRSGGELTGVGIANMGLIIGYLSLLAAPVGQALLLPALNKAGLAEDQAHERNQLKMIALGITLYRDENEDAYPPDLATLLELKTNPKEHFVSPHTGNSPTSKAADMRAGKGCDFIYRRPESSRPAGNTVIVHSKATNFGTWQGILFADGSVGDVYAPETVETAAQAQGWILPPVTE